jgi:2-polyprenyl-3-methyl-5-hydroxy-6-metoxy-1,4-benzoquinol methylase
MRDPVTNIYTPAAWENPACPVCNETKYKVYEKFGSEFQYAYVECNKCGLIYTNPRPRYDQDFVDSCYASYYQFAENLKVSDLDSIPESSMEMFRKELAYITQYDKHKTAVLDIGSGMGTFLQAAKAYYTNLVGLDVSKQMASFVKQTVGVDVEIARYDEFEWKMPFSLIHMSHVIEHIPTPNEWLQHSKKILAKDGILVINVPNKLGLGYRFQHWMYKLGLKKQFSSSWNDPTRTPDHLYEPTIRSFKYLIDKNGFEILEYYTYSRKDPTSSSNIISRIMNRWLHWGSNITFITRVKQ